MQKVVDNLTYEQFEKLSEKNVKSPLVKWLRTLDGLEFKDAKRIKGKIQITFTKGQLVEFLESEKRGMKTYKAKLIPYHRNLVPNNMPTIH